jgi:CRP/FNR family cyclic AMP-dependent transcriptional regulator
VTGSPSPPERLVDHPFLRGLDGAFVHRIAAGSRRRTFEAGEEVVREGAPARELLLIVSGKVALELGAADRPRRVIQTVGPGEVLGWSWLVAPERWRFDARAVKPTVAHDLDARVVREAMEADPAHGFPLLLRLLAVVGERLENTRLQLMDLHGA